MMVTSILPVDKRKSKVFLEEGFAFVLYRGEVERFGIEEGKELEADVYQRILTEVLLGRAKERALYLLKSSGKTEAWMKKKLQEAGYPEEAVDYAMNFLKEYGFINDRAYAESYVRSYGNRKSRRQLVYELSQKGVSQEEISEAFSGQQVDDVENARQLLRKRLKGKTGISYEERGRLSAFLGRKGYSYDVINRVMREIGTEDTEEWQE